MGACSAPNVLFRSPDLRYSLEKNLFSASRSKIVCLIELVVALGHLLAFALLSKLCGLRIFIRPIQ